jgi:hypothetical protein
LHWLRRGVSVASAAVTASLSYFRFDMLPMQDQRWIESLREQRALSTKNWGTALLLSILLGIFGVDRSFLRGSNGFGRVEAHHLRRLLRLVGDRRDSSAPGAHEGRSRQTGSKAGEEVDLMRIASAISLRAVARYFHERFEFWCAVLILSAAWFYYPYCQTGPTLCVWKKLLGVPCPGCGLTRGVCFLVHGQWAEAVRFNPLSLLAVGILLGNLLRGASGFLGRIVIDRSEYHRLSSVGSILNWREH